MERISSVPDPVVIGQDDQSEVHVQPAVQSGRRQLDIRVWHRGTAGMAPSRTGFTLEAVDLTALQEGIAELLQASDGARRVARVVWDSEGGRRLRAETEPFGTRYVARLGFWQRVRDSWKPIDDGLVIAADRLQPLQNVLNHFTPWLQAANGADPPQVSIEPKRDTLNHWPPPGADWLTTEPDRIAFHPKGVRLTCTVTEKDARHWLELRQWRRDDTLWLPEPVSVALAITDLDTLLSHLLRVAATLASGNAQAAAGAEQDMECADGSVLRLGVSSGDVGTVFRIWQQPPARNDQTPGFEPRVWLPAEYLPRFGRALAQGWFLLAGWLSEAERASLQRQPAPAPTPVPSPRPVAPPPPAPPRQEKEPPPGDVVIPSPVPVAAESTAGPPVPSQVFAFGAESETPGTVIPGVREIRVIVEGLLLPRSLTLPIDVVARVITGLDELNILRRQQARINPILLCDRPDCAVYGRLGTAIRPDAVELRVWTGPTTSESVSFEAAYLPDLIEGLRQALRVLDRPVPPSPAAVEIPASPPAPLPQPSSPARLRPVAPAAPLEAPGPVTAPGAPSAASAQISTPLGAVTLGQHHISLTLQGHSEIPLLSLRWEATSMELPVGDLEDLLADVRSLYYDALRGRRGRTLSVGEYPIITISVENRGAQLYCVLQQDVDGEITELAFPANEVPTFLNAARAALTRT